MKKIHRLIVPHVVAFLFAALLASAQDKPAVPELTETEELKLSLLLKDVQLADKDVQLARMQFLNLSQIQAARQRAFDVEVQRLRAEHNLPVEKFSFDRTALKFVPVPEKKE